jgi:hypothetical protein
VLGVAGAWLGYEIYRQSTVTSEQPYGVAFNLIDQDGQPIPKQPSAAIRQRFSSASPIARKSARPRFTR